MVRVQCVKPQGKGCGYSWEFSPRVPSWQLKASYTVTCPKCGEPVFVRVKRELVQPKTV